jgi:hypothetical protein
MYKVITHTIKEEHFGHPATAEVGMMVHSNTSPKIGQMSMNGLYSKTDPTNSPKAVEFRMVARNLLDKYLWRLRLYIVSALEGSEDAALLESEVFKAISQISYAINEYYGNPAAMELKKLLDSFTIPIMEEARAIKAGRSVDNFEKKIETSIDLLSDFLSKANPTNWPKSAVRSIFTNLAKSFNDQTKSRKNKNWLDDIIALNQAQKIILVGDEQMPPFAEIFAKGIISAFPQKFNN